MTVLRTTESLWETLSVSTTWVTKRRPSSEFPSTSLRSLRRYLTVASYLPTRCSICTHLRMTIICSSCMLMRKNASSWPSMRIAKPNKRKEMYFPSSDLALESKNADSSARKSPPKTAKSQNLKTWFGACPTLDSLRSFLSLTWPSSTLSKWDKFSRN